MDNAAWLQRLRQFVDGWRARLPAERQAECFVRADPPLSADQLRQLRESLDVPLPESVAGFLTTAASRLVFEFAGQVGKKGIGSAGELFNYWFWEDEERPYEEQFTGALQGMGLARECVREEGGDPDRWEDEPDAGLVLSRALWRHGLPLTRVPNTDCLALWCHDDWPEPAVAYLAHDDVSYLLAPDFDTFLEQWEQLGYDWGQEYIDRETGLMSLDAPAAVKRRRLLGLEE